MRLTQTLCSVCSELGLPVECSSVGDVVVEAGLCKDVAAPVSWLPGQPWVLFVWWPFVPSQNVHYLKPFGFSGSRIRQVKVFYKKKKKNGSSINAEMISWPSQFQIKLILLDLNLDTLIREINHCSPTPIYKCIQIPRWNKLELIKI